MGFSCVVEEVLLRATGEDHSTHRYASVGRTVPYDLLRRRFSFSQ